MKSKKVFLCVAMLIFFVIGLTIDVNAAEKHNLSFNTQGLPIILKESRWDETNRIHYVNGTITLTDANMETILNQTPGNGSSLASFYIGVTMEGYNTDYLKFEKSGSWVPNGSDINTIKSEAKVQITTSLDQTDSNITGWSTAIMIEYNVGSGWTRITGEGNGATSVRNALSTALGGAQLEYGKNFRFIMVENQQAVMAWVDKTTGVDTEGNRIDGNDEYVVISYQLKFPITASMENGTAIYAQNVNQAIESGAVDIVINENSSLTESVTIPSGVTLRVADGATFTVPTGSTITFAVGASLVNNGNVTVVDANGINLEANSNYENNGTINVAGTPLQLYTISLEFDPLGGTVVSSVNKAKSGDEVTLQITPNEGYEVTNVESIPRGLIREGATENEKIFTMPTEAVTVNVSFSRKVVTNPLKIIAGNNQSYTGKDLEFKINTDDFLDIETGGPESDLQYRIYVNDKILSGKDWTSKLDNNQIKIVLKNDYLKTLAAGTHKFKVDFYDGTSDEVTFKISKENVGGVKAPAKNKSNGGQPSGGEVFPIATAGIVNPQTDDNGILVYIVTSIVSIIGIVSGSIYLVVNKKKV